MKKKISLLFAVIAMMMTTVGFVSCDLDDNTSAIPDGAEEMTGIYIGDMRIHQESGDTLVKVSVQIGSILQITPFHMNLMMDSILNIDPKSETAKGLKNITYYTNYTVTKNGDGVKKINFAESASDLYINVEGKKHIVRLPIAPNGECLYTADKQTVTLNLKATKAKLDGKEVERFKDITLTIDKAERYK